MLKNVIALRMRALEALKKEDTAALKTPPAGAQPMLRLIQRRLGNRHSASSPHPIVAVLGRRKKTDEAS
jgi:hypothetical protein